MDGKGIQVSIVADSISPFGKRITTMLWKYPRFILAEVNTHRAFSRNSASSRAIPTSKIINSVMSDPAMPVFWGKQQTGMQAYKELAPNEIDMCKRNWLAARDEQLAYAERFAQLGLHKQIANRILEPWMHMLTLVTCTEWGNFFNLRVEKSAQPEFQVLAAKALEAYMSSIPTPLVPGAWHLPFNDRDIDPSTPFDVRLKIVTARAARTSYLNFDGVIDVAKDIELHDSLAKSGHWSPFEHAAQCRNDNKISGNFRGWTQYRKTFENENKEVFNGTKLLNDIQWNE